MLDLRPQTVLTLLVATALFPQPAIAGAPSGSEVEETDASKHPPDGAEVDEAPARLLQQVELDYPEEAAAEDLHGDVSVLVDITADGDIADVRIEDGPEVFHAAALDAGRRLRFVPAERNGRPVASTTRVWFHFAPPLALDDLDPIEVVVHADDEALEDPRARTTLDADDLASTASEDLARTIDQVAGVQVAAGTSDAAKPIIRGQQERRLLVLYDGIRHESQKWGPDHGTEIDPFAAGEISVIRGAAGARYGPDAIGGVVLVDPPAMREEPGVGGRVAGAFATNGTRPWGGVRLDAVPAANDQLSFRLEGNLGVGADKRAPTYVLGNTASRTWNLGGAAQYRWDSGRIRVTAHHHDFSGGIFYGQRTGSPADFRAGLERDKPVNADNWRSTFAIDRPRQDVSHDVVAAHATTVGDWGTLEATYAFQHNRRRESEAVRNADTAGAQFDFTLRTHSLDVVYKHPEALASFGTLEGGLGVQGAIQENLYRGLPLLPNYRQFHGSVYAFERASFRVFDVVFGVRYDALARNAYLTESDYEQHQRRDTLDPKTCTLSSDVARCPTPWDAGSASLGGLVHVVPDHVDLKLDLSSASRFPNLDEQYLVGSAPSLPVYGVGFPGLGIETALGASLTAAVRYPVVNAELSVYANRIEDFIYFAPERNPDGSLRIDVTSRGSWPRYSYRPIDADVRGLDGSLSLGPELVVGLDLLGSLVRMQDAETREHLVGTPPDQLTAIANLRPPEALRSVRDVEIGLRTDIVGRQSRVDPDADFAPAPGAYVLVGATASVAIHAFETPVNVGLSAANLLNTTYRSYTSLTRYTADMPGRDVRLRVGVDF